jgi:hypothetical protein
MATANTPNSDALWKLTHDISCKINVCTCIPERRKELLAHMIAGCSILDVYTREAMVSEIKFIESSQKETTSNRDELK